MSGKQQGLRYFQKFLNSKASERNALAKKVLRYVMAVGFVLSPWLGGEAYAGTPNEPGIVRVDGTKFLDGTSNVAHIRAENVDVASKVGLNSFKTFKVVNGEIANLYFQDANGRQVDTLVNTVQNQISISGTVNAIRNGQVGGNLYFISPSGMVVGSSGVINAGSLTVMTTGIDDITDPATALSQIGYVYRPLGNSPITIQGKINTANGIDLRSLSIEISKNANGDIPCLKTGMVFNSVVNTDGLVDSVSLQYESSASGNGELQLKRSDSTDAEINLVAYKYAYDKYDNLVKSFGNITLSGCDVDAIGAINITSGESLNITNNTNINTNNAINIELENTNNNNQYVGDFVFESGRIEAGGMPYITVGNDINIGNYATFVSTLVTNDTINFKTQKGNISNYGNIQMQSTLNMQAGQGASGGTPCLINGGTIESQGGGLSLAAMNNITNNGTIEANAQIKFAVGGTLTNQGTIESTSSNVQAHLGRNFKNIAVYNNESTENRTLIGGIIEAGGNVQVDYKIDNEGIGVASSEEPIDGIYNSGLIWAKGDEDPVYVEAGNISSSGSGNIWLTSAYNITNYGTMKANRQITLNARDFLHNYGLIQGVTYLDIKSIMGYVYNHKDATIKATGGNIDLSSGQANLQIDGDTNGQKKELYRKFTPIIIEGSVEATSDDDDNNQTKEGNIEIKAYLGDIYVNGATIETKPELGTNGEVKAVAGNVILDAAQNITIGFETVKAWADDPTTHAGPNGENKDKYERNDEREYFINTSTLSQKAAEISGSNITLISGSGATNTISISAVNNALTASDSIELNSGGNVTVGAGASVTLGGSLQLQGNNIYVAGVQRSGNPTEPLKVEANGAGGTDSAINSLNLNIAGDVLFNTLNVNTAEVNVSGDLQIKQLHVADQAHFTSNNTMIGVYGEATEPRGDQSDALYRDMGNGSDSWMGINIKSDGYQITNGTEIQNAFAGGTEYPVQMSSKLVDVDPQETLVENYGDVTGNFGRFDLVDDSVRPSGGIESTDQGSQTVLKQDENGLHIETSDNKVDNGPQIEAGDNKVDNGSQIEAGDNKGDQGSQIEAGDDKDDQGSQIEASDDKENEDSQIEAGDKKKDKSKRDKKDKREKQKKDK